MGRRSGGGGGRSRSSARRGFSNFTSKSSPPPTPTSRAPPPAEQGRGGLFSGLAGMMMQGAAIGTGSAMAHRAIDSVMGDRGEHPPTEAAAAPMQTADACFNQSKAFTDCMTTNNGDMGACQFYFDMLQQCKQQGQL